MGEGLTAFVERALGEVEVAGDRSWPHGDSGVFEVRDRTGAIWFVKRHRDRSRYAREVTAYCEWVSTLGDRAPALCAHDDALQALVLSSLPGERTDGLNAPVQRQAGALLRRLHDAAAPTPWPGFATEKREEFAIWAERATTLLDAATLNFAGGAVGALAALPPPTRVPCHLDYSPRNWLVEDGNVGVIDFEWAAREVWVNDLARLYFGSWRERPDLREAFLDSYGRDVTPDDRAILLGCGALTMVRTVAWAHGTGDAPFETAGRENLRRLMAGEFS